MSEGKDVQHRTRVRDVEEEETEVDHLLAEPRNDRVSVDDCFRVDNKSRDVDISGHELYTCEEGDNYEKDQVKHSDIGLDDKRSASIGPSAACEDYLLDTEFVHKDSDCEDFSREESSSTSSGKPRIRNGNDHDKLCKLHLVSQRKCGCQNQIKEKTELKTPILYTSQNRRKLQSRLELGSLFSTRDMDLASFSDFHRSSIEVSVKSNPRKTEQFLSVMDLTSFSGQHQSSEEASLISNPWKTKQFSPAEKSLVRLNGSEQDMRVKGSAESSIHKRLRRPPVRYIDEFSGSVSLSDEKHSASDMFVDNLKSSHLSQLDSDEENDLDEPEKVSLAGKGSKNCSDRRKHQMIWTLLEVIKLVDGISHYGVGRWTEIQRLFFPTSTYRTPVDLRDKWRNLLKASNAWIQNDQEEKDEESQKNGHRQLQKEILHRISELGRLYPYPVKRTPTHTPKSSSRK
uniref:Uncharacterized protein n=1 Tax=Kalanchoe fedtschenkoi TaxID=63787 RepID=A0A7N1A4P8_KALFE